MEDWSKLVTSSKLGKLKYVILSNNNNNTVLEVQGKRNTTLYYAFDEHGLYQIADDYEKITDTSAEIELSSTLPNIQLLAKNFVNIIGKKSGINYLENEVFFRERQLGVTKMKLDTIKRKLDSLNRCQKRFIQTNPYDITQMSYLYTNCSSSENGKSSFSICSKSFNAISRVSSL